jgi:hypothetical protein
MEPHPSMVSLPRQPANGLDANSIIGKGVWNNPTPISWSRIMDEKSPKFYCLKCKSLQKTHRGICSKCGVLIGCSIIKPNESESFYGCQDNHRIVEELQVLTREKNKLLMDMFAVLMFKTRYGEPSDTLVKEALRDVKQIARNALREFEVDEEHPPEL